MVRVTVWGENVHEREEPAVRAIYPDGMHARSRPGSRQSLGEQVQVRTATLEQHEHGLTARRAGQHRRPDLVGPRRPRPRSPTRSSSASIRRCWAAWACSSCTPAHYSKIFKTLLGTPCDLRWRNDGERELVWTVDPSHPIAAGVPNPIVIDAQEMYGEPFAIPQPDELIFISSFTGGEVFRGGCTWVRGAGADLLLQPGRPGVPRLPPPRRPAGAGQRGAVGGAAAAPGARRLAELAGRVVAGEGRRRRRRLGRPAAHQGLRGDGRRHAGRDRRPGGGDPRANWRREFGVAASASRAGRTCSTSTGSRRSASPCPTFLHAPIAIAALERGLHVLSEKPIALERRRRRRRWSRRPARPGACSTSRSTTAAAATSSSCAG